MPKLLTKATAALKESVASIIACDDDDEVKRKALAETFAQFQYHLDCNAAGGEGLSKGPLERGQRRLREAFGKIFAAKADDGSGEADDSTRTPVSDHHASKVADLLVETGKYPHRARRARSLTARQRRASTFGSDAQGRANRKGTTCYDIP